MSIRHYLRTAFSALLLLGGFAFGQALTVWTSLEGASLEWLEEEIASFEDAFGLEVETTTFALGELRDRAVADAPEGMAGDLFVGVPNTQLRELALAGVLANMTSYATSSYLADLSEPARTAFTIGGELLGLPLWVEGPALIVNAELLPELPATYEETVERARELTTPTTFGFVFDIANLYYAYTWIHSYGGYVFSRLPDGEYAPTEIGLANEGAVAGASELQDLRFEHELVPSGSAFGLAGSLFIDGALAMTYDGPWAAAQFRNAGVTVEVHPLPPRANGDAWSGFMGANGVLLNAFSERQVPAVNLAKWLVRPEAQVGLVERAFRVPASMSAAEASGDQNIAGFAEALADGVPLIGIPEMGSVWQPMGSALTQITASPDADVESVLQDAVDEIAAHIEALP